MHDKYYTYSGLLHVHSNYSDGTRTIPEIAAIANELDVDFMLMSDHNTLQPKLDGLEGWYGHVLVGIGSELNDAQDRNHYLAFNINSEIERNIPAEEYVCRVKEQGGFGIIAHPDENRAHLAEYPPYPWTLWDSDCYDGMEIWNQMSEWMEGLTAKNKYIRALHPRRSIVAPKAETLARWDALNRKRSVVGVGGVDAHGYIYKLWGFIPKRIFRYKISFRTIRTYVILKEPLSHTDAAKDLQRIYSALRSASCFVAHRYFGDASGFRFFAQNKTGQITMGEQIPYTKNTKLRICCPKQARIKLIADGKLSEEREALETSFEIDGPGLYRVEIWYKERLWILSNHMRVI